MAMKTLEDAFLFELENLLDAEKQITTALPKMIDRAHDGRLKKALQHHLDETKEQVHRLEEAFRTLDESPRTDKCDGMRGIIAEGEKMLKKGADPEVRDALLISAAQRVEHYEIAAYGAACTWAEMVGYDEAAELLKQNLSEEKEADRELKEIAKEVNQHAMA